MKNENIEVLKNVMWNLRNRGVISAQTLWALNDVALIINAYYKEKLKEIEAEDALSPLIGGENKEDEKA